VIKTSSYYLSNTKSPPLEKVKSHLQRIERQTGIADRVITALNDIARLPMPDIKPIAVESLLRETVELNRAPDNVQLEIAVDPHSLYGYRHFGRSFTAHFGAIILH
jgi:two-component system sensor kinase FixL